MKEELKKIVDRLDNLEKRMTTIEKTDKIQSFTATNQSKLEELLVEKISMLKPQDLVILILHMKSKQTKEQIKTRFHSLGATKKMLNWFQGGNFKQRLIDTGIVFENGVDGQKIVTYSLTVGVGKQKALSIIKKIESEN